jgi:nucleoside-diphosphate-sugar epimerase
MKTLVLGATGFIGGQIALRWRPDAYLNLGLQPWDMAAGLLIVEEAGGRVTDIRGRPWQPWAPKVLVSNGHVHQALVDEISLRACLKMGTFGPLAYNRPYEREKGQKGLSQ